MKRLHRSSNGNSHIWAHLAACSALLGGVACEGNAPRDLGSTSAPFTLEEPFESPIDEFIGRWVGSANDILALNGVQSVYRFPSGSTQFLLEIAPSEWGGIGPLEGFIRFGSGEPLPPPTDPESGYPAGLSYDTRLSYAGDPRAGSFDDYALPPFEGVDYSIGSRGQLVTDVSGVTTAADGVVSFTFSGNQPLDAWCRLQTPHPHSGFDSNYSCIPDAGGQYESASPGTDALCGLWGPSDVSACEGLSDPLEYFECVDFGEPVAFINCDKVFLCSSDSYCTCSEEGCTATDTDSRLTVRRVGNELVGVFQNAVFVNDRNLRIPLGEVRLARVLDE